MSSNKKRLNRKRIILVILLAYMALLAILTVCSNQILQMTLPGVTAAYPTPQTVSGTYYNIAVGLDSICYDENGNSYVLILETRETPLGERNFVRRVPVSILEADTDAGLAAIEGALSGQELIVYEKDGELDGGQQVRVK